MRKSGRKIGQETCIQVSGIQLEWNPERGTCNFEKLPVAMMWVDTTLAGLMAGVQAMVGPERFALALQQNFVRGLIVHDFEAGILFDQLLQRA